MTRINVDVEVLKRLPEGKVIKAVPTPNVGPNGGCCDCFSRTEATLVVSFKDSIRHGGGPRIAYFCIACGTYNGEYIWEFDPEWREQHDKG